MTWVPVRGKDADTFQPVEYEGRRYTTTIESRELVALINESEYIIGDKYSSGDKNVAIDVRLFDRLKRDFQKNSMLDLAVRNTLVTYDDQGVLQDRYYAFSGWYRINLEKILSK